MEEKKMVVETFEDWKPKTKPVPVWVTHVDTGDMVQLEVTELSIMQRDRAIKYILDSVNSVAQALSLLAEGMNEDNSVLVQLIKAARTGDNTILEPVVNALNTILGHKLSSLVCTILASKHNAIRIGLIKPGDVFTESTATQLENMLRSEIQAKAEPVILMVWKDVEGLGEMLGNWQKLLASVTAANSEEDENQKGEKEMTN